MYTPLEPTTVHSAYYFIMLDVLISLFMSNTGLKWFKLQWDVINSQIIRVTQLEGGGELSSAPPPTQHISPTFTLDPSMIMTGDHLL